jgi:hypothetical protein
VQPEAQEGGAEGERREGNKREGESSWKSGGGRVRLYTWRRTGLADEVGSDYRHMEKSVTGLAGHEHAHFALGKPQIPQSLVKFSKGGLEMYLSV